MPNTVKKYINIDPRHSGLMGLRLLERENAVTPLENPDLEPIPIQSHYLVNPSYWGNTTVNGEPVDITGYRDSNTGIARYLDGEYGYVNLPDNYGEWMMDGVTIYPERPRLKGVVHNYFDDAQLSKILGQPNVIAPIGVGDSEIQPIQFPTKAPEKYHGQDLDRFFANLLTFGTAGTEEYASQLFKEGDYLKGSIYAGLPLLVKGGPSGNLLRTGFWGYNLYNDADDAAKMILDRNGWGYGKDVAKIVLDSGALLYDWTKGLLDALPYLLDIARQRNNMGYWARTASDIAHHPLDTYRTMRKGTYVHDSPSLRRAITESKLAVREGADYTRNYYLDALKVDMPEANITAKTNIPGAWGEQIPGTNNFYYTFYRSPLSNLSRNTRDFKRVGGHEYTHLAEDYLNNRYFFPSLNVPAKPYYLPNVNHPIMSTATVDDFMEGNIHGRSPEETWANYMGYNAGGGDPVMSFTDYNIEREGIPPPRGFISDYENYLKSLSSKALLREGEIQLFNRRYGQKALGGTITNNSDSTILADNNNYILDFKGNKYGLPTVRYDNGGHLFGNGGDGRTHLPHVGDSWRNTETNESGTVVGYAPDAPYMGDDGKLYPTTSPVVKYDSGETLFGVTPQYTLPEVTATGHLRTPADNLDKVMLGTLAAGVAPMALPEIASGTAAALANPYVDAALTSYFGAHGINDIANGNANAMTALEVLPMARLAKPLWNAGKSAVNYMSEIAPEVDTFITSNTVPEITAENAASITPEQWTVAQDAAIGMPQKSLNKIITENTALGVLESQNSASDFDSLFDLSSLYDKSKQIVRAEQEEAMREAEQKVFDYLGSERHIQRIMEGGKSREEAERIARHMWENAMTAEGELGPLGAAIHGEYDAGLSRIGPWWKGNFKYTLDPKYTINENLFDNAVRRNVFHELGGHGATLSYSPTKSTDPKVQKIYEDVVKEWFPEYKEVYDHNAALKPVRRPLFENAEEVGLEDGMLHYLEDVDEYSARARAENIEPGGDDFGALYRYFTPESLENLKNNVWGTIPLVLGTGLTGYGLYDNFNSTNSDIHTYGGPLVLQANMFGDGGKVRTYRIPKNRRLVRTIHMNNGTLTAEIGDDGKTYWFRNGKYISPERRKNYKFYDKSINGYRALSDIRYDKKAKEVLSDGTPVYAPNLFSLLSKAKEAAKRKEQLVNKLEFRGNGNNITLRTKGVTNLATVPMNLLDSIAVNSGRSNVPIKTGLGLVAKESTLGGTSIPLGTMKEQLPWYNPYGLVNNHAYFGNPEDDYLSALARKYDFTTSDAKMVEAEKDAQYAINHGLVKPRTPQYSNNILADAFARYVKNPNGYNSNLQNYASMVTNLGNEVWGEPQIQQWWNTSGKKQYERGRKEGM